ncbi:MAG: gamma-glutamyl-gamma-aminobutyrate hydrolase family protein [Solirubrobacteraceae bacterium]
MYPHDLVANRTGSTGSTAPGRTGGPAQGCARWPTGQCPPPTRRIEPCSHPMDARRHTPTTPGLPARPSRAIIGVSTSEMRTPERVVHDPHSEPVQSRELALGLTYPEAIRRAGAVPVIIPPLDTAGIEPLLDGLCGLCLSGGPDLHPTVYGATAHPALGPTEPHLDLFEVALLRAAEARELPVLAICRGLQVLNVARGGTLVQDLPSERPSDVAHRQQLPGTVATHEVMLEGASLVADALGVVEARVNSFHHQAVDVLGSGLRAVGWASDGVVEAVQATDRAFTIAVQWHAESMVGTPEQARLLRAFADAAMAYRAGAARAA